VEGYGPGDEMIVSEERAAKILRTGRQDVDLIEVIEDQPTPRKTLPG
jgi:hypothetical protein